MKPCCKSTSAWRDGASSPMVDDPPRRRRFPPRPAARRGSHPGFRRNFMPGRGRPVITGKRMNEYRPGEWPAKRRDGSGTGRNWPLRDRDAARKLTAGDLGRRQFWPDTYNSFNGLDYNLMNLADRGTRCLQAASRSEFSPRPMPSRDAGPFLGDPPMLIIRRRQTTTNRNQAREMNALGS